MFKGLKSACAALVIFAGLSAAPQAGAETLADALSSAYKQSGLLDQNRAVLRAADEDVAVAVAALRPAINYSVDAGFTLPRTCVADGNPATAACDAPGVLLDAFSTTATISAQLVLYDFGRTKLGVEIAKENVLGTRAALLAVEQQVLLRAVSAFLTVRSSAESVALRNNNVRLITQELRAARDRFEVGEITRTDVALAEARLAAARARLAAAEGQYEMAREEFRAAVGRYPGQLAPPPPAPITAKTLDEAKAWARRHHPNMVQIRHQVTIGELNVELGLAVMKPTLTGNANVTQGIAGRAAGISTGNVGVSLKGSIYQGGKLSALYRKAIAQRDATRANLHVVRLGVDQNVANAWAQLAIATASIEATERQIRAAREALRGAQEEAKLGARTTLDVLNAEQELLDAESARISAESDQYLAVYTLLSAMGLLTAEHLKLGVPIYDPAAYYNAVRTAPVREVSPQGEKLDRILKALGKN